MRKIIFFLALVFTAPVAMAHVDLTYPTGGETFNPGEQVNITWEILIQHETLNWDLYFSADGGASWDTIRTNLPVGSLSYLWTVPEIPTGMGKVRVVQDNVGTDYSDDSGPFTITNTVGISEKQDNQGVDVYPNPARDYVHVALNGPVAANTSMILMDGLGRTVRQFSSRLDSPGQSTYTLNIEDLAPGQYFVVIRNPAATEVKKLLVEN